MAELSGYGGVIERKCSGLGRVRTNGLVRPDGLVTVIKQSQNQPGTQLGSTLTKYLGFVSHHVISRTRSLRESERIKVCVRTCMQEVKDRQVSV